MFRLLLLSIVTVKDVVSEQFAAERDTFSNALLSLSESNDVIRSNTLKVLRTEATDIVGSPMRQVSQSRGRRP